MSLQQKSEIQNTINTARANVNNWWQPETLESVLTDINDSTVQKNTCKAKKIAVFGDSLTANDTYNPFPLVDANLGTVTRRYSQSGTFIIGTGSTQLCGQVDTAVTNNLATDIIIIHSGSNGTQASDMGTFAAAMAKTTLGSLDKTLGFEAYRYALWKLGQNWPSAKIFCVVPPQQNIGFTDPDVFIAMDNMIKRMAQQYNAYIIDARSELGICSQFEVNAGAGRYLLDGLHFNSAGRILAADFYSREIIKKMF